MIAILLAVTVFCLFVAGLFVVVFRRLAADEGAEPGDGWLDEASADRYRPMQRLLDKGEYQSLRAHPAFNSKMLRRFRGQRVRAFRGYLTSLSDDFSHVCRAVKSLIVVSAQDRADLSTLLVRQQLTFTLHFMLAYGRLSLHAYGVGTVDVSRLLSALDSMRLELNTLVEAAQPAGA